MEYHEDLYAEPQGISIVAVIVGWVTLEVVAFVIGFTAGSLANSTETGLAITNWLGGPLSGLAGGYVAGRLAKRRHAAHGLLAAVAGMALALCLASFQGFSVAPVLIPWALMLTAAFLGARWAA